MDNKVKEKKWAHHQKPKRKEKKKNKWLGVMF